MDDTSRNRIGQICEDLQDRNASDVVALWLGDKCSWAEYLVIATASSRVHIQGLSQVVRDSMQEKGMGFRGTAKRFADQNWQIIDGGSVVVSLMNSEAREFYALEDIWFEGEKFFPPNTPQSSSSS